MFKYIVYVIIAYLIQAKILFLENIERNSCDALQDGIIVSKRT